MPKLTLSADAEIVRRAKALAAAEGTSVSALFERFVVLLEQRQVHAGNRMPVQALGPVTRSVIGVIEMDGCDERSVTTDALFDQYGLH